MISHETKPPMEAGRGLIYDESVVSVWGPAVFLRPQTAPNAFAVVKYAPVKTILETIYPFITLKW